MCYRENKYKTGKTVRYKAEKSKHKDAVPYNRSKSKKNFNYED